MEQDRLAVESVVCSGRLPPEPEKENGGRGASEWNPKRRRAGRGRTGDRETEFNVPLQWVTRGCNCRSGRNRAGIAVMGVVRWLHRVDTDISATSDEAAPLSRFSAHRTADIRPSRPGIHRHGSSSIRKLPDRLTLPFDTRDSGYSFGSPRFPRFRVICSYKRKWRLFSERRQLDRVTCLIKLKESLWMRETTRWFSKIEKLGEVIGEENDGVGYRSIKAERGCMVGALLEGVCVRMI